jgi:hypothetical protein
MAVDLLHPLQENPGLYLQRDPLLSSPFRLAALLPTPWGGSVVLTLYEEEKPRRYLAPQGNLTPHLAWAHRNLPPPHRLHLSPTTGEWGVDWREGWSVALEALAGNTPYLLPAA